MTAVSHSGSAESGERRHFARLARGSQKALGVLLCSLAALTGSGCIVAAAPDYREPETTRANILSADPPTQFPIVVTSSAPNLPAAPTPFTFEIQSEDGDDRLVLAFYVDFGLPGATYFHHVFAAPSTFAEIKEIPVNLKLADSPLVPDGCHTFTMLVMHEASWNQDATAPYPAREPTDVSRVNWVMYVNVPQGVSPDCPRR